MQLGMLCMHKDLRTSAERRLIPVSKLHVLSNVIYLMQNGNREEANTFQFFMCL